MKQMICQKWALAAVWLFSTVGVAAPKTSLAGQAHGQQPPRIWFGPLQEHRDAHSPMTWTYYDFPPMLAAGAPWQAASRDIDVIMLNVTHIVESAGHPDSPSLADIKAMLSRTGLKAGGGGSVVYTDGLCHGAGVEGMTDDKGYAHEVYSTIKRWHDAGLPLETVGMDGPFYYGYQSMGAKCHFSPEDVAQRAATTMKMIRDLYPRVTVVDGEGPGEQTVQQWLPNYHRFLNAFREAYGAPIDYLDMDLHWTDAWHNGYRWVTAARQISDDMHKQGLKVSLIINAEDQNWDPDVPPTDPSAAPRTAMTLQYWMAAVHKHIDLIKQNAIPLDAVDMATWMRFPQKNLPETDPQAWTSVADYAHAILVGHSVPK